MGAAGGQGVAGFGLELKIEPGSTGLYLPKIFPTLLFGSVNALGVLVVGLPGVEVVVQGCCWVWVDGIVAACWACPGTASMKASAARVMS